MSGNEIQKKQFFRFSNLSSRTQDYATIQFLFSREQ